MLNFMKFGGSRRKSRSRKNRKSRRRRSYRGGGVGGVDGDINNTTVRANTAMTTRR